MKQLISPQIGCMFLGMLMLCACTHTRQVSDAPSSHHGAKANQQAIMNPSATHAVSTLQPTQPHLALIDYLRRVPGLQVNGNMVTVRGISSFTQIIEPLYIIDNVQVGTHYPQAASLVDVNDIQSVSVLKDVASTTQYGLRGSGGVIIITTKRAQ